MPELLAITAETQQSELTREPISLEDFLAFPPDDTEWVNEQLIEKTGVTIQHSLVQGRLIRYLGDFLNSTDQGDEPCPEILCQTRKQVRRPDVAYLPVEFLTEFRRATVASKTFPLIAEIASPNDSAEELFAKAFEYVEAGCQEVWLVFPQGELVLVRTSDRWHLFNLDDDAVSTIVLPGFKVSVRALLR